MRQSMSLAELNVEASRLAQTLRNPTTLRPALKRAELLMVSAVKENFSRGADPDGRSWKPLAHPRPAGGDKPLRDRGLLAASMSAMSKPDGVAVGTNRPGAGVHQNGGLITATRRKFLAIPLTKIASRAGSPRRFPQKLHAVISGKAGVLLDAKGKAHYALVKSVRIPARPFLGFGKPLLDKLSRMFGEFLAELVRGK